MVQTVSHYGVHMDAYEIWHLLQAKGMSGNFIGLPSQAPFQVRTVGAYPLRPCPHLINFSEPAVAKKQWNAFKEMMSDPLVYQMLPLPKIQSNPVLFFNDPAPGRFTTLITLARLASSVRQTIFQIGHLTTRMILEELGLTNIAPLVLTGVKPENQMVIERLADSSMFLPRRLILLGDPTVVAAGHIKRETTHIDSFDKELLAALPMENLGALILRQFARGEEIGTRPNNL